MDTFDFSDCKFINSEMKFYTYQDFCNNCYAIKRLFDKKLTSNSRIFYKWYVYSNIYTTMNQKNKIWDFLNDYITIEELLKNWR